MEYLTPNTHIVYICIQRFFGTRSVYRRQDGKLPSPHFARANNTANQTIATRQGSASQAGNRPAQSGPYRSRCVAIASIEVCGKITQWRRIEGFGAYQRSLVV